MKKPHIDSKDIDIINTLIRIPCITNTDLSILEGLSISETRQRVERITSNGLISTNRTKIYYEKFGYKLQEGVFVSCMANDRAKFALRLTESRLVITAINIWVGNGSDNTWFFIIILGKSRSQITQELNELFNGLEVFRADSFKKVVYFKLNEFTLSSEDL